MAGMSDTRRPGGAPVRRFSAWGRALLAAGVGLTVSLGISCDKPPRREVVIYCSADQDFAEPILAEFERASGIRVRARFDAEAGKTVGLVRKLRAESAAPAADVFWSSEVFYTVQLAREGLLAPYDGEGANNRPDGLADPQGRWFGFGLRARVIAYATDRVSAADAPRRLEDLLAAKWRGRVVMARPTAGTTGGDVASWFAHYGPGRAREILAGLKANGIRIVEGNSTAVRFVANGRADVCLTDTDDVYVGQRNGWKIARNFLDQGGQGVLAIPNTAMLVQGGPNPKEARELMAFLLGPRVERALAESDSHNTPVHPTLKGVWPQYEIPRRLDVPYARIADFLPQALTACEEILPK